MSVSSDPRFDELRQWVSERLGLHGVELAVASADASFRRYFRIRDGARSWIAMDAPPEREDSHPYVKVAELLREAGVHAPAIHAQDLARGFLLLSDLGTSTYLQALTADNADALFADALDALVKWQRASRPGVLPPYDEALLRREVELFPDWYLGRHLGLPADAHRAALEPVFQHLIAASLAQARVFVHRDYMPRNLMVSEPNPGVLDFQDAVYGPITYDVVSLFRDAFISWPEARVIDWSVRYWEQAKKAGLPVPGDFAAFYRDFEWMGLQRHLKVIGIFARLHYRDGKAGYLDDTPRFFEYARAAAGRYRELGPLARVIDAIENRGARVAYSF